MDGSEDGGAEEVGKRNPMTPEEDAEYEAWLQEEAVRQQAERAAYEEAYQKEREWLERQQILWDEEFPKE